MTLNLEDSLTRYDQDLGLSEPEARERTRQALLAPPAITRGQRPEDLADVWKARARQGARSLVLLIQADSLDRITWTGLLDVQVLAEDRWPAPHGAAERPHAPQGASHD